MTWEILSTEIIAETPRFDLIKEQVRLPNGKTKDVFLTQHEDSAIVMAVTADGKIIMLNEYRYLCGEKILSLAGGHFEEGDLPIDAARRELIEETGYSSDHFEFVQTVFADPPRTRRRFHFFIAHDAYPVSAQQLTEFEDIDIILMPPEELISALVNGRMTNLPTMGLIYLGLQKLGFLQGK